MVPFGWSDYCQDVIGHAAWSRVCSAGGSNGHGGVPWSELLRLAADKVRQQNAKTLERASSRSESIESEDALGPRPR